MRNNQSFLLSLKLHEAHRRAKVFAHGKTSWKPLENIKNNIPWEMTEEATRFLEDQAKEGAYDRFMEGLLDFLEEYHRTVLIPQREARYKKPTPELDMGR